MRIFSEMASSPLTPLLKERGITQKQPTTSGLPNKSLRAKAHLPLTKGRSFASQNNKLSHFPRQHVSRSETPSLDKGRCP